MQWNRPASASLSAPLRERLEAFKNNLTQAHTSDKALEIRVQEATPEFHHLHPDRVRPPGLCSDVRPDRALLGTVKAPLLIFVLFAVFFTIRRVVPLPLPLPLIQLRLGGWVVPARFETQGAHARLAIEGSLARAGYRARGRGSCSPGTAQVSGER